jgi:transcriptional regulator GlxA family with amidase domain
MKSSIRQPPHGARPGDEDAPGSAPTAVPGQGEARLVVMLVYPGVMAMDVYGPLEAFAMANTIAHRPLYRLAIAGMTAAPVETSLGIPIAPSIAVTELKEPIDTILVSGGFGQAEASVDQRLLDWLRAGKLRARRCGSICTGAFVLAAAGLLDGKRATTHWAMAAELGQRHPTVSVSADRIFVRDGNVYTSAGVTSGIDLAIGLIEEDHGRMLALKVARALVVYLKRPSGQSQFSNLLLAQFANSPPVRLVQEWALENLGADLSIKALARRAHMSERTFRRTFTEETGETPRDFVGRIRIEAARNLFEEAQLSVQAVATRCGFENVDTLRRAFLRRLGTTPQKYLGRFRPARD